MECGWGKRQVRRDFGGGVLHTVSVFTVDTVSSPRISRSCSRFLLPARLANRPAAAGPA
jgi:hypothetical protein